MANGDEGSYVDRESLDYMKLEILELKQLLIDLTTRYKVSEDSRKVLVKRNALLIADNKNLHKKVLTSERRRILAEADAAYFGEKMVNIKNEMNTKHDKENTSKNNESNENKRNVETSCSDLLTKLKLQELQEDALRDVEESNRNNVEEEQSIMTDNLYDVERSGGVPEEEDEELKYNKVYLEDLSSDECDDMEATEETVILNLTSYNSYSGKGPGEQKPTLIVSKKERPESSMSSNMRLKEREESTKQKIQKLALEVQNLKNYSSYSSSELVQRNRDLKIRTLELEASKREITRLQNLISSLTNQKWVVHSKKYPYDDPILRVMDPKTSGSCSKPRARKRTDRPLRALERRKYDLSK